VNPAGFSFAFAFSCHVDHLPVQAFLRFHFLSAFFQSLDSLVEIDEVFAASELSIYVQCFLCHHTHLRSLSAFTPNLYSALRIFFNPPRHLRVAA
jgi:hypothetical protein